MNKTFALEKPQPIREILIQVITGECGRCHNIGFPGVLESLGEVGLNFMAEFGEALSSFVGKTKWQSSFQCC